VFTFEVIHSAVFAKSEGKKEMASARVRMPHGMRLKIRKNCRRRVETSVLVVMFGKTVSKEALIVPTREIHLKDVLRHENWYNF